MLKETINNSPFLQIEFLGNPVFKWLLALAALFLIMGALKIFQKILIAKLKAITKKTKTEVDDIVIDSIQAIHWPFYVLVSFYFALNLLEVSFLVKQWAYYIFIIAVVYYVIRAAQAFVDFGAKKIIKKKEANKDDGAEIIKLLSAAIKVVLWLGAIVLILSNLGYNVTSLIAGLGIGGIAIALALQNILGDAFSSLAIYFDKPFRIGDFVIVGEHMGVIKKVGIKTTRIQALQGEEIVISNNELTNARIQNFGVMQKRRIVFNVGVAYNTPAEKLKKIPEMIKKIINNQETVEVDRTHLKTFGDSSLIYEVVYYVQSGDYSKYMDIQQSINLSIISGFEKENIEIAFPTQTIYLKKD